jgi:hypothetical protein
VSHSYRAYGLSITSQIAIPGLERQNSGTSAADLRLEVGPEPDWVQVALKMPAQCFHKHGAEPKEHDPGVVVTALGDAEYFELSYNDGARFVVNGATSRMWGEWTAPLTVEDFATYFLGPVMGFVLRRRGLTALHASCVCVDGHAVALSGEAHAGKSTTAAALALRGVPVLCEDITALYEKSGRVWVESGYPRVCLWPDSVQQLFGAPDALPQLTPTWEKCYLALDGKRAKFEPEHRPLGAVYLFGGRSEESTAPRLEELSPREGLLGLVQNTYMNWILDRTHRAEEFDVLARMMAYVPVRRVVPNGDPARIGALCDLLISDAEQQIAQKMTAREAATR